MPSATRRPRADPAPPPPGVSEPGCVDIHALKEFAFALLPEDHPLRAALLAERNPLTPQELIAKLEVWMILINRRA